MDNLCKNSGTTTTWKTGGGKSVFIIITEKQPSSVQVNFKPSSGAFSTLLRTRLSVHVSNSELTLTNQIAEKSWLDLKALPSHALPKSLFWGASLLGYLADLFHYSTHQSTESSAYFHNGVIKGAKWPGA